MFLKKLYNYLCNTTESIEHGFTLVEFIVIISIFAVMASVSLFNFRGFRSTVATNNLVYDVALELKSAQTLGVSAPGSLTDNFQQIITTIFERTGAQPPFSQTFSIFREGNVGFAGDFDATDDTIVRTSTMRGGYTEKIEICSGGSTNCTDLQNNNVFISFRRPNPEPIITSQGCSLSAPAGYAYNLCRGTLRMCMVAEDDPTKVQYIYVEPTGQIRVVAPHVDHCL